MTAANFPFQAQQRRVVVTGLGIISSLGLTLDEFWQGLTGGQSGVSRLSNFCADPLPVQIAGEVRNFAPERFMQNRKSIKIMGRHIQLAVAAARNAFQHSGLSPENFQPEKLGVSFGTGTLNAEYQDFKDVLSASLNQGKLDYHIFGRESQQQVFPLWLLKYIPNMAASHVSIMLNARGPSNTITTLCTSSAHAIGEGFWMIRNGQADLMITGGTDAQVTPLGMVKFYRLGLLAEDGAEPSQASRPFDQGHRGMVMGEGAAVLVLEEREHALRRKAAVYAEISGYGAAADTWDPMEPNPDGPSLEIAARHALSDAACREKEVDSLFLAGNGIPFMDCAEARAMRRLFPGAPGPRAAAIKSSLGHTHSASGALASLAAVLSLQRRTLPPTINLQSPIRELEAFRFSSTARSLEAGSVLVNNFSFGGNSACLVFRAHNE